MKVTIETDSELFKKFEIWLENANVLLLQANDHRPEVFAGQGQVLWSLLTTGCAVVCGVNVYTDGHSDSDELDENGHTYPPTTAD